jgi:tRNA nucleotidyltransferase (CCA-adding enzyme)
MKIIQAASILKTRIRSLAAEPPSVWTFVLDEYPRLAVYAVYLALSDDASRRALESYALTWRHLHATISGATLKQLGLPPGPRYQLILDRLRAAWLDGEIKSGAQEQALLEQLFTLENGAHPPRQ